MEVWELAVLIYALTVLMVNVVSTVIMIGFMVKMKKPFNKMMKVFDKSVDEMFNE